MPKLLPTTAGCEIEVNNIAGLGKDVAWVQENFIRRANLPDWSVKTDGSCGRTGAGVEVVSPVFKTEDDLKQVVKACANLKRGGFKVSERCGLHVHIGVGNLTEEQRNRFIKFFVHFENAFYLFDPTRKKNKFSAPISPEIIYAVKAENKGWGAWTGRYFWMNGMAYVAHTTVEFRLMGGTLDETHIVGWIEFLLHIYDQVVNFNLDAPSWDKVDNTDDFALLQHLLTSANFGGTSHRSQVAREWAMQRFKDVQGVQDVAAMRAERRARRLAAWKGKQPFVPIFVPGQVVPNAPKPAAEQVIED